MEEETYGVSGTNPNKELMGALAMLAKSSGGGQKAFDAASAMYAPVEEANPWEASLRFFLEMGKQASQPGATVLGSAVGSGLVPLDYLTAKKKEKRDRDQKVASTAMSLAPSLAPKAATYRDPKEYMIEIPVLDDEGKPTGAYQTAYRDFLTAKGFADLQKQGARFKSVEKTTGSKSPSARKYIDTSVTDNPDTPTIDERMVEMTFAEYQTKRIAGNNTLFPLSATDSALSDPVDTSLGKAKKTVIYGNGTTLTTYDSGTVLRTGGSNEPVTQADFETVMDEARLSGVTDTIRGAAAAEAGRSAVEIGVEAQKSIGQLTNSIELLKKARVLVDLPTDGANTGWLESKFPSVFASSIALDNIRSSLGLAVVGMNTFGALSEGELELALATALPNTMQEAELSQWISDKIAAQEKLRIHYAKAAEYLTNPLGGGISKWVEIQRNRFEVEQGEEAQRAADVITNMTDSDFRAITPQDKMVMTVVELQAYLARLQGQ